MSAFQIADAVFERTLCDGLLRISATAPAAAWLHPWLPLNADTPSRPVWAGADEPMHVEVGLDESGTPPVALLNPFMRMKGVEAAWVGPDEIAFAGPVSWGGLDLAERSGRVVVCPVGGEPQWDVYAMLTLMSAMLLGRSARALVHAGAVVSPRGEAILLVGDAFAGKTTTLVNLVRSGAGWRYLSDDHVVLSRDGDRIMVEGWPRMFHMDEGYESGEVTRRRHAVDPASLALPVAAKAPLAGAVLPVIRGAETSLESASAGDVLTALIRQSPWLAGDRAVTRDILALLQKAAMLPARGRLGLAEDSYRDPNVLLREWRRLPGLEN